MKENKRFLSNSILFFIYLTLLTIIVSGVGHLFGWQGTYARVNPVTGSLEGMVVSVENLFSVDGLRYIIGNSLNNFVSFAPLGMLIISLMGIGVAYKSGLLPVLFTIIGKRLNRFWLTFLVSFLGILSSFGGEIGYVVLIPLAAILYLVNNRNPIIGIVVAFVSISSGYSINFLLTNLDYSLLSYSQMAAVLIDKDFVMGIYANIYFVVITSIILTFFITYLTEKFVAPRIPKYKYDEDMIVEEVIITKKEKRGLVLAALGFILIASSFIYMIIPNWPLSGILLDKVESTYLGKLFGSGAYFNQGLIYITAVLFLITGVLYGLGARTIKSTAHFSNFLYESLNNIGNILVLIFFASQFITIFRKSNLGTMFTVWLVDIIETLNFTSLPLIILLFILVAIANLLLPSSTSKWAIMSPVVVPLFMESNITPEFTQIIFRISESATNIITPLLAYFVIFIGFIEFYNKEERSTGVRQCYKVLPIYTLGITLLWLFIIVSWYIIGLPIGVNTFPTV